MHKKHWLLACLIFPACAVAQTESFKDIAQRSLMNNPEVQARLHAWQAAREERTAAAGGFFPRVDLNADTSRQHRDDPVNRGTYDQNQVTLTLTQMLYDGLATRNEVRRLDHAALVRFFELHDTSENLTLEIVRAWADVQRYRELVSLAEDNYVRHRAVFNQIQSKVEAKVGRRVDLETSSGRLALAESNLLTDTSNLHDVSARFARLTGKVPGKDIGSIPALADKMPRDAATALASALRNNPALWASLQNIKAARSAAKGRDASYQPRVEFQVRNSVGNNIGGTRGNDNVQSAGLVLNWNLYNGGSDNARTRQYAQQISAAEDLTDQSCRDMRQTLSIAYNNTIKLSEQLNYLDQHQLATEKARDAYRNQFDIGQRSLLDLLDTENELFQARRAYTNAVYDLTIAHATTGAAMGQLVPMLNLTSQGASDLPELHTREDQEFLMARCPAEIPSNFVSDKKALDLRVAELARETAVPAAAAPAPVPAPAPMPAAAADDQTIRSFVSAWAAAWSAKDVPAYLAAYDTQFQVPDGLARQEWESQRRSKILGRQRIGVTVEDVKTESAGSTAKVRFRQTYKSDNYTDTGIKTMELVKKGGAWKIVREQFSQ